MAKPTVKHADARIFDHDDLALGIRLAEESLHQFLHGGINAAKHRNLN